MIERVIAASIRHRGIVLLLGIALSAAGLWAAWSTPIDAIPDLSETQILVYATWPGHAPEEVDSHVTQPISIALQGIEDVRTIRASSEFGYSLLHLIFEDHVALKTARSAVGERIASSAMNLPPQVTPSLAPDAPATGQIYWYTVEGIGYDLGQLREIQDTLIKHQLANVPGVAEAATVGGFPTELEIEVDPLRLAACGLSLEELLTEIRQATQPVAAEAAQGPNSELLVRTSVLGATSGDDSNTAAAAIEDLLTLTIKSVESNTVRLGDVAEVRWAPGPRRGALEKDGNEVVGGVVMMTHGHNPLEVTQRIERKIVELASSLPSGVRIVPGYDRKRLIHGAIGTVSGTLAEAMITATLCVLLVLLHFRSSLVISLTLPLSVLSAFLGMSVLRWLGVIDLQTNIMSLAGMAISIGVLVDSSIVMVENVMHRLRERFGDDPVHGDIRDTVTLACQQVGRPLFFSVLIMLVSFLPVFALSGMEGKMFRPLAVTKSLALAAAALLAISFVPALCSWLIRGRLRGERDSWLVRGLMDVYRPTLGFFLDRPAGLIWFTAAVGLIGVGPLRSRVLLLTLLAASILLVLRFARQRRWGILLASTLVFCALYSERQLPPLESEFVSPLDEGTVMDMPITVPRASMAESVDDLKARDMLLCRVPEVEMVMGKAGRAETAADPAPVDMIETMVSFLPPQEWPRRHLDAVHSEQWTRAIGDGLARHGVITLEPAEHNALIAAAAPEVHRRLDMALREHAYQGRRELVRQLRQQLPIEAARAFVASLRRDDRLSATEDEVIAIALAATVDPQLRTILAESPSGIAAAELHQLFLAELTRRELIKAVPNARSHVAQLEHRLAQARRAVVSAHRRALDRDLLTRARETLGRLALEEILGHAPPPNDEALRRDFSRLRAFRIAPPQPQVSGHHGLANYEPAAFDPMPRFDALHAELTRPLASGLSLRRKRREELVGFDGELDRAVPMPGWTNVWTMPIQNRVDMLATGVNTTVGIRVLGTRLDDVVATSQAIAETLRDIPGAVDVIADPIRGKGYLDIRVNAHAAERVRLPRSVIHHAIEASMGGTVAASVIMNRQRVPIRVTLGVGDRSDPDNILRVPITAAGLASVADRNDTLPKWVTLGDVADVKLTEGPATIKSEKGLLRNYVRFNVRGREVLSMVAEAQQRVAERVQLPEGVFLEWTGQYEHQARARRTLWIVAPLVLLSIFGILWATYRDLMDALLIVPAVLGALAGGLVAQVLLGDRLSITVAIGYVACFGMAASTGIIMLVYLREAVEKAGGLSALTLDELREAVLNGATQRLRPKILTEATTILGLAPMLWATGTGSEVIRPMAAPVLGGILIADEVIDLLVPVLFYAVRKYRWQRLKKANAAS